MPNIRRKRTTVTILLSDLVEKSDVLSARDKLGWISKGVYHELYMSPAVWRTSIGVYWTKIKERIESRLEEEWRVNLLMVS